MHKSACKELTSPYLATYIYVLFTVLKSFFPPVIIFWNKVSRYLIKLWADFSLMMCNCLISLGNVRAAEVPANLKEENKHISTEAQVQPCLKLLISKGNIFLFGQCVFKHFQVFSLLLAAHQPRRTSSCEDCRSTYWCRCHQTAPLWKEAGLYQPNSWKIIYLAHKCNQKHTNYQKLIDTIIYLKAGLSVLWFHV